MLRHACRLGLEGIVSKRATCPTARAAATHWLKAKCTERQEFVIAGYVPSTTSRKAVGSLVLGVLRGGKLVHVGRVGTGFTEAMARRSVDRAWSALERPTSPFAGQLPPKRRAACAGSSPSSSPRSNCAAGPRDGLLRHASFKGLREDKSAAEVVRESRRPLAGKAAQAPRRRPAISRLTHPDRVLWPDVGPDQAGPGRVLRRHRRWVLPHLVDRPLVARALPGGCGEGLLLPEARLGRASDRRSCRRTIRGRGSALHPRP